MTQRNHPVFSGFLAVVWLAVAVVSANAANPSFSALVWTNSGGVITPIKGPTNLVSITSGLASNPTNVALRVNTTVPWTNGVLQQWANNDDVVAELFGTPLSLSITFPPILSRVLGVDSHQNLFLGSNAGWTEERPGAADVYAIGTHAAENLIDADDVVAMDYYALNLATNAFDVQAIGKTALSSLLGGTNITAIGAESGGFQYGIDHVLIGAGTFAGEGQSGVTALGKFAGGNGNNTLALGFNATVTGNNQVAIGNDNSAFQVHTTAADGDSPLRLNTSITHTSGNLAEIANNGTNKFTVGFAGSTSIGTSGEGFQFHFVDPTRTASTWFSSLGATANINVQNTGLSFQLTDTLGNQGVSLEPTVSSGSLPFLLRALQTQSSSNIFEVRNDTVQAFGVTSGNGIFIGNLTNQISRDSVNGNALIITNTGAGTGGLWVGTTNIIGELASKGSGGGTAGTVINTGTPVAGNVPYYTDTTGTNVAPSTSTLTFGNASSATFTNNWNLSGATDPVLTAANSSLTSSVRLTADGLTSGNSIIMNNSGWFIQTYGTFVMGNPIDLILTRDAAATFQFGSDAATPTAQVAKGSDGSGTDRPGGDLTIGGGKPTGTGTPGKLKGSVTATGTGTGSSLQSYTTAFALGGTLKVDTTTTGNIGAGEDDLISYTIPAGQLGSNGDYIEFDCFGTFGATANTAQLKIYYDGTAFFDTTSLLFNGLAWKAHGKIVRTSATAQKITVEFTVGGTLLSAVNGTVTTYATDNATLSGTTVFKITGQDTGGVPANDKVVQEGMILKYYQGL